LRRVGGHRPPRPEPPIASATPDTPDAEFAAAHAHFRALFDPGVIDEQQPFGPAAVYTASVVVHLLVLQRLAGNASLRHAVDGLLLDTGGLPANRRVGADALSANTAAYSRGRTRLAPAVTRDLADRMAGQLMAACPPSLNGRRVFVLDGTTVSLPGTADLRRAFPPGRNQHGESHWPLCRMVVAHELASGCAGRPEWGPFNGPGAVDEVTLATRLLPRIPENSVLMADRNFGIFAFAHAAAAAGHDVLTRLTGPRFRALKRVAAAAGPGRWALDWAPSKADRAGRPDWPADVSVRVRLHEVVVRDDLTLWLLTTLDEPAAALADVYRRRVDVETDIRDVKRTLKLDETRAQTAAMWEKEVCAGGVAYNLVVQLRRLAARRAGVASRRLSFAGTLNVVAFLLSRSAGLSPADWLALFERALRVASEHKLPNRPGRAYPRTTIPKRRKHWAKKPKPPDAETK